VFGEIDRELRAQQLGIGRTALASKLQRCRRDSRGDRSLGAKFPSGRQRSRASRRCARRRSRTTASSTADLTLWRSTWVCRDR